MRNVEFVYHRRTTAESSATYIEPVTARPIHYRFPVLRPVPEALVFQGIVIIVTDYSEVYLQHRLLTSRPLAKRREYGTYSY